MKPTKAPTKAQLRWLRRMRDSGYFRSGWIRKPTREAMLRAGWIIEWQKGFVYLHSSGLAALEAAEQEKS